MVQSEPELIGEVRINNTPIASSAYATIVQSGTYYASGIVGHVFPSMFFYGSNVGHVVGGGQSTPLSETVSAVEVEPGQFTDPSIDKIIDAKARVKGVEI